LDAFLKLLKILDISEHGVQTLAATMEVHGAGIILCKDLWKRTSQLLTGASLESILEWTENKPTTMRLSSHPATSSTTTTSAIITSNPASTTTETLSDKELARRLQAKWNGEVIVVDPPPSSASQGATLQENSTAFHLPGDSTGDNDDVLDCNGRGPHSCFFVYIATNN
jgi:hypothetical protein